MKNKKIFITFVFFIITLILAVLLILGKKYRNGYLSDLSLDIYSTLKLNDIDIEDTKQQFTADNELDEDAVKDFIFANSSITNYSYIFKIRYYSKIFKNSDIYTVHLNTNKLKENNDYINHIYFDKYGSPFGYLISSNIINFDKIDNIEYSLKLQKVIYIFYIVIISIILIIKNKNFLCQKIVSPDKKDYYIFLLITFLCFFSYIYSDILVIFPYSVNFFNVNPIHFFYEVYEKVGSYYKPDDLPYLAYVLYSIIFLPLWLYSKLKNITYYTWYHELFSIGTFELMYIKFVLLLFLISSSIVIYKISKKAGLSDNNSKLAGFLLLTSSFSVIPALIISQVEIIMLFFTLLGILDYFNNKKRFLLWFSIAIPLKLFPFFILIPLVCLREKKLKNIFLYIVLPILPYLVSSILFKSPNPSDRALVAFRSLIGYKIFNVSVFILTYSIICLFSFLKTAENDLELYKTSLYICFITFSSVAIVNTSFHRYWIIILAPFISIMLLIENKYLNLQIILESAAALFYAIGVVLYGNSSNMISMYESLRTKSIPLIRLFFTGNKYNNMMEVLPEIFSSSDIANTIYSFFIVGIIMLLIMYYKMINSNKITANTINEIAIQRFLIYIRLIPSIFIILVIWFLTLK
ncbi:hypothetical protein [uncultured Brachyspira sp.]|uniref:hypothetical protein n=1 Tax=uncultured Brachyspira sp. TaxID=221953 RepID=UPI0025DA35F1|nr:hypothetical protein [uncultured Brachyspira sp.]